MVRFIVRPPTIRRTPKRLSRLLGARRTAPSNGPTRFDWSQDLFLAYPRPDRVLNADAAYIAAHNFFVSNKRDQRLLMDEMGIPTVPLVSSNLLSYPEVVIRPLFHRAGQDYQIASGDDVQLDPTKEYASELIKKTKEFRVIYYKGKHVSTYLKTNPNNISYTEPWTFEKGCIFHTITQPVNDVLANINFYPYLENSEIIKSAHVAAVDVLYRGDDKKAFVCETNLCPGLSISRTLDRIRGIENNDR